MEKKGLYSALVLVMLLLLPGISSALTNDQKALVGLMGVYVVVEEIQPQAERLGLTRAQIQTDVELRLRKAGVKVLTKEEWLETPGMQHLYVNLSIMFDKDFPIAAFSQRVELREDVKLDRGFRTIGAIWDKGSTGTVGNNKIRELRETLGEEVDKFINDYLAANPKK